MVYSHGNESNNLLMAHLVKYVRSIYVTFSQIIMLQVYLKSLRYVAPVRPNLSSFLIVPGLKLF
jgi:hypothetical protein